jgi:transcriptional regulator with XRE-family HTH domain
VNLPRNIVGPIVREFREKQGLTQGELVTKLNLLGWDVSRDIIARIEGQVRWVADFEILKLAAGLGIEYTELLRRSVARGQKRPQSLPALLRKSMA